MGARTVEGLQATMGGEEAGEFWGFFGGFFGEFWSWLRGNFLLFVDESYIALDTFLPPFLYANHRSIVVKETLIVPPNLLVKNLLIISSRNRIISCNPSHNSLAQSPPPLLSQEGPKEEPEAELDELGNPKGAGKKKAGPWGNAWRQFWAAHQRFYR